MDLTRAPPFMKCLWEHDLKDEIHSSWRNKPFKVNLLFSGRFTAATLWSSGKYADTSAQRCQKLLHFWILFEFSRGARFILFAVYLCACSSTLNFSSHTDRRSRESRQQCNCVPTSRCYWLCNTATFEEGGVAADTDTTTHVQWFMSDDRDYFYVGPYIGKSFNCLTRFFRTSLWQLSKLYILI